jgi:uncharacterized protein (DUF1800 family)
MVNRRALLKFALSEKGPSDLETPEKLGVYANEIEAEDTANDSSITKMAPILALAVAACGGEDGPMGGGIVTPPPAAIKKPKTSAEGIRFLTQAQLSGTEAEAKTLQDIGYIAWMDQEIAKPVSELATVTYDRLGGLGNGDITKGDFFGRAYFHRAMWLQFIDSNDALRKRVSFALSEYFVLSIMVDGVWHGYGLCHYWDVLNKYAFGNFRELLEEVTLNKFMGDYLSLSTSKKEDARTGRRPDENYAREVMQLFTIGLTELNPDGSNKLGADGNPISTYTNDDVTNIARAISGWEWQGLPGDRLNQSPWALPDYVKRKMTADPTKMFYTSANKQSEHSLLEAKFLGVTIPANTDADTAMKTVLDTLFNHANTPVFFSKQMIQRLVTSNPSPQYIERVAKVFINNGQGVRGDLGAVFKAILSDDEALSAEGLTSQTYGKVREPILRFVQWARTFKLKAPPQGYYALGDTTQQSNALGQMFLSSPSVFNFFRPGYVPAGTAIASNKLVAPEFQIVNEVSNIGYVNFMHDRLLNKNNVNLEPDYSNETAIANDSTALVDRISLVLTANQLSQATKDKIKQAVDSIALPATNDADARFRRVGTAILLTMVSPQYIVQK